MLIHMMRDPPLSPPKWVTNLLSWYCKRELLEDIERDLHEYFDRTYAQRGFVGRGSLISLMS
jgi:hypothetical protein